MVTDEQVEEAETVVEHRKESRDCGVEGGMDPGTAQRYLGLERLPSELKKERLWRSLTKSDAQH